MSLALMFGIGLTIALTLQTIGSVRQYAAVNREFQAIKKRNYVVAVGKCMHFGMNRTAVLAFNSEGVLQEAHLLEGMTVFAKLKRIKGHDGEHYSVLKKYYSKNKRMACVMQAIKYMEEKYD